MSLRTNLARWLIARSDVEAALHLLSSGIPSPSDATRNVEEEQRLERYIRRYWPVLFARDFEAIYAEVYNEAGKVEANINPVKVYKSIENNSRYIYTLAHLRAVLGQPIVQGMRWLDYGANRGLWAAHLYNHFGGNWTLWDIDPTCIDAARSMARLFSGGGMASSAQFIAAPEAELQNQAAGSYDIVLCFEVLEHVLDPKCLIVELERVTSENGLICISVPYGPFEYDMWVKSPERRREHLREFSFECLMEMVGNKSMMNMQFINYGRTAIANMEVGHWIVSWRKNSNYPGVGAPNLQRKCALREVPFVMLPGLNHD